MEVLTQLDTVAKRLGPATPVLAHPDLAEHLPALRAASAAALQGARAQPPRYDGFRSLVGVCNPCHTVPS